MPFGTCQPCRSLATTLRKGLLGAYHLDSVSPAMTRRGTPSTGKQARATGAGTERFRERFADALTEDFFRPFAGSLNASSIGIGTYLGECDDADDASYAS